MISLAENGSRINIKELAFSEPHVPKRLQSEKDFSGGIWFARSAMEGIPSLPEELKSAVDKLDHQSRLFASESNYENLKRTGTREGYLAGNFLQKSLGIKMFLIETAEHLRSENRDMSNDEAEEIKEALLSYAKSADDEGNREVFNHLQIIANYPEVLVWVAEVLTFQESTLSIPNYSQTKKIIASDMPEVPVVRKF
jgi:hypothetical protein